MQQQQQQQQWARRRQAALVLVLLALSAAPTVAGDPIPSAVDRPSFVAVGDGLTESAFSSVPEHGGPGWGLLLQQRYTRKADVVNRGFGGYFTPWFVDYTLDRLFDVPNPSLAIIFLGVKDSMTKAVSGSHYVSPQQFGANVDRIIRAAQAAGARNVLLISPPPVCEACKAKSPKPWDRENAHTALYVAQLAALARKHGAGFLNIFEAWSKDPDWHTKYLLPDKLHLSPGGSKQLAGDILAALDAQLPAVAWANLPVHFPLMNDIDKDDPGAAFGRMARSPARQAIKAGGDAGQQQQQQQQRMGEAPAAGAAQTSSGGLAAHGVGWLLLGLALLACQLLAT